VSKLLVGIYHWGHDSNFAIYDYKNKKFQYIKYERINNIKHYNARQNEEWKDYLKHWGYNLKDIKDICIVLAPLCEESKYPEGLLYKDELKHANCFKLSHHKAHLYSSFCSNGIVADGEGTDSENLSIFKNNKKIISFNLPDFQSFGVAYNNAYIDSGLFDKNVFNTGWNDLQCHVVDIAGKVMAWEAYGEYLPKWQEEYKDCYLNNSVWLDYKNFIKKSSKWTDKTDDFYLKGCFVKNITYKYGLEIIQLLKSSFNKDEEFTFSGGIAQNLTLNNMIKKEFHNFRPIYYCGDEGLSIGALNYLAKKNNIDFNLDTTKIHLQSDEDFDYASIELIKEVASLLANDKIILWAQGHGEIGPRALGHRSILANPGWLEAKENINKKVKNREWYRPYAASVTLEDYQKYFDLAWESPHMLYQAKVKNTQKFKSITHHDGTCRIQTVSSEQKFFHTLLKEFEKNTGYPILLNTSMNRPGYPIVGTKKNAYKMLENSHADYLVIGNKLLRKEF